MRLRCTTGGALTSSNASLSGLRVASAIQPSTRCWHAFLTSSPVADGRQRLGKLDIAGPRAQAIDRDRIDRRARIGRLRARAAQELRQLRVGRRVAPWHAARSRRCGPRRRRGRRCGAMVVRDDLQFRNAIHQDLRSAAHRAQRRRADRNDAIAPTIADTAARQIGTPATAAASNARRRAATRPAPATPRAAGRAARAARSPSDHPRRCEVPAGRASPAPGNHERAAACRALRRAIRAARRRIAFSVARGPRRSRQMRSEHRLGGRPDVDLRMQQAPDALDVEQRFLQQDQLRLQRQLVAGAPSGTA